MTRAAMWFLLGVVAVSAAVLSFSALKDLADLCGFHHALSPLLPAVVDAGAAAGCLVWLSPKDVTTEARRFARALTWVLLASSVAGNAIVHGLSAYGLQPHWTLVVTVSGVAPAVLGAVVHLSVLVGHTGSINESMLLREKPGPKVQSETPAPSPVQAAVVARPKPSTLPRTPDKKSTKKGHGRRALAAELGISDYAARKLLEQREAEQAPRNGARVLTEAR